MGNELNAEQVKAKHIQTLGPELGPVYHALYNECAWLYVRWQQFVELFGTKSERIELLNQTAGTFFRITQDTFWDDTLLSLCRLTDKPDFRNRKALSIRSLPKLIADPAFQFEVQQLVTKAVTATAFARDWRDRRIAHRNLDLLLDPHAKPLEPASRKSVSDALAAISRVIERIYEVKFDANLRLSLAADSVLGDAHSLLYFLRDGFEANEQRITRLREGKSTLADLRSPPREI